MSTGWICPRCNAVYGPFVWRCPRCSATNASIATPFSWPFNPPECQHDYGEPLTGGRVCRKCGKQEPPPQRTVITSEARS